MAEIKIDQQTQLIQEKEQKIDITFFQRGSDILMLKIMRRIMSYDKFKCWFLNEFKDIGKYHTIRKILQKLEKKGYIKKVKAYPVFWERLR